jgi:acyl-coenzyme A synthetase/AMP-(fatty) acid ligase
MAIDEQRRSLTFAQYRQCCERVAAGLKALGVTAEARVSWQLPTCLDALILFGALARLQAVQIPLVPLYRDREMSFVLEQTKSSFVVVLRLRGDGPARCRKIDGAHHHLDQ